MAKAKRLVVGNWKMYVADLKEAVTLARSVRRRAALFAGVDVVLAPAFPLVPAVAQALKGSVLRVGAQTLSSSEGGAHTGEVSAAMLKALGTSLVIVGHSERRAAGESDIQIREELKRAADMGLRAVLCIGEKERDQNGSYFEILGAQIFAALSGFPKSDVGRLIVAYEPVWAIGKSAAEAMKPAELEETAIFIKKVLADVLGREKALRVPILYGGSVEESDAAPLLGEGGVSGFLVGHASASAESFGAIVKLCKK